MTETLCGRGCNSYARSTERVSGIFTHTCVICSVFMKDNLLK